MRTGTAIDSPRGARTGAGPSRRIELTAGETGNARSTASRPSLGRILGRSRRRCIVLGLDGVSAPDLQAAIDRGLVPTIATITRSGSLATIRSSIPAVSTVAWSSFMTACNPGRHGIFGFTDVRPDDYGIYFPSSDDLRTPTLWERAAADGLGSVVVNLPGTYPAGRMKGSLVAGFVAPSLERACHPRSLAGRLATAGYAIDVDVTLARRDMGGFLAHVLDVTDRRIAAMDRLLQGGRWSLAILAFTEADRLQHLAWRRVHASEGPERSTFEAWLVRIDAFLARLLERYPDAAIVGLSDHGFGPLERYLNVDAWLVDHGYLAADGPTRESTAFSLDQGRVYVNGASAFPDGPVSDPADLSRITWDIRRGLRDLVDARDGRRPVASIVARRDAHTGSRARLAPSLILLPARGYELKSSRRLPVLSTVTGFEGTHTHDDALFFSDRPLAVDDGAVEDVGATVLDRLRLHRDDVDGRSLTA